MENKFYGDRSGSVEDPFGHQRHFATHVEDVPPGEMTKRAEALSNSRAAPKTVACVRGAADEVDAEMYVCPDDSPLLGKHDCSMM